MMVRQVAPNLAASVKLQYGVGGYLLHSRFDGTFCPICLQMFHSRQKVIRHIEEKSVRCRTVLVHTFPRLSENVVAELDAQDATEARCLARQGRRRHFSASATIRLQGPLLREAVVVGISHATLLKTQGAVVTIEMIANIVG